MTCLRWEKWWSPYEDDSIRARAGGIFDVDLSSKKWKHIPGCWGMFFAQPRKWTKRKEMRSRTLLPPLSLRCISPVVCDIPSGMWHLHDKERSHHVCIVLSVRSKGGSALLQCSCGVCVTNSIASPQRPVIVSVWFSTRQASLKQSRQRMNESKSKGDRPSLMPHNVCCLK